MNSTVNILAEGLLDACVAERIILFCNGTVGNVYGKKGVSYIQKKARSFVAGSPDCQPLLVVSDFCDAHAKCFSGVYKNYFDMNYDDFPRNCILALSVQELEAWLIADKEMVAKIFRIRPGLMPDSPESLKDPKRTLISLCRNSSKKSVQQGMVPSAGHGGVVGPLYTAMMSDFILNHWDIEAALANSKSLRRCCEKLRTLLFFDR